MLKQKILAVCVASVGLGFAGLAPAIDGTINFTGVLSTSACTVSSVAGVGATAGTVDFGTVSTKTLNSAGKMTVGTPFKIELTDCDVSTPPTITFEGEAVTTLSYTDLFKTDISSVGIRIVDAAEPATVYIAGEAGSNTGLAELGEGVPNASAAFNAYLVAYESSSPSGAFNNTVTFTINYS